MIENRSVTIAMLLLVGSGTSSSIADENDRREMWEEPSHQLVFANGPVRILDVRIVPGVTSEFHKHRFATTYVIIQDALVANQLWEGEWSASGPRDYRAAGATADQSGYVANPFYHRVRNEDKRSFHVVAVVNERDLGPGTPSDRKATIDNPWFREHRLSLRPDSESGPMRFSNDVVLVQPETGSSHVVENGLAHSFKGAPGGYSWHPAGRQFSVVNGGRAELQLVLLEVKAAD